MASHITGQASPQGIYLSVYTHMLGHSAHNTLNLKFSISLQKDFQGTITRIFLFVIMSIVCKKLR